MCSHPSKDELANFALGKLPPDMSSVVEAHLGECPPCQETILSLEQDGDTLLTGLRRVGPAGALADVPPAAQAPGLDCEQFAARLLASGLMSQGEWDADVIATG